MSPYPLFGSHLEFHTFNLASEYWTPGHLSLIHDHSSLSTTSYSPLFVKALPSQSGSCSTSISFRHELQLLLTRNIFSATAFKPLIWTINFDLGKPMSKLLSLVWFVFYGYSVFWNPVEKNYLDHLALFFFCNLATLYQFFSGRAFLWMDGAFSTIFGTFSLGSRQKKDTCFVLSGNWTSNTFVNCLYKYSLVAQVCPRLLTVPVFLLKIPP